MVSGIGDPHAVQDEPGLFAPACPAARRSGVRRHAPPPGSGLRFQATRYPSANEFSVPGSAMALPPYLTTMVLPLKSLDIGQCLGQHTGNIKGRLLGSAIHGIPRKKVKAASGPLSEQLLEGVLFNPVGAFIIIGFESGHKVRGPVLDVPSPIHTAIQREGRQWHSRWHRKSRKPVRQGVGPPRICSPGNRDVELRRGNPLGNAAKRSSRPPPLWAEISGETRGGVNEIIKPLPAVAKNEMTAATNSPTKGQGLSSSADLSVHAPSASRRTPLLDVMTETRSRAALHVRTEYRRRVGWRGFRANKHHQTVTGNDTGRIGHDDRRSPSPLFRGDADIHAPLMATSLNKVFQIFRSRHPDRDSEIAVSIANTTD